jgi:uncharacterized DUF497 family protein
LVFEWDPKKAALNRKKHGVSFEEASSIFEDPEGFDGEDLTHSAKESRRLRLARSSAGRVLVVAYTTRRRDHEEVKRVISARRANRKERARYQAPQD